MTYEDKVRDVASLLRQDRQPSFMWAKRVLDAVNVKALLEALREDHAMRWSLHLTKNVGHETCSVCRLLAEWSDA